MKKEQLTAGAIYYDKCGNMYQYNGWNNNRSCGEFIELDGREIVIDEWSTITYFTIAEIAQ